ncbi:hypothetical protein [Sphingopyxis sp.]|jgi:putative SOS response-associated peptidase YedK|uniref:hypothetical protein n=1 Tax=Sphingopyxis sp. TaxID=1908224 RepID=UPI00311E0C00
MIWDGREERQIEAHWGLGSCDPEIGQILLLKSETARIENPCRILANEFGIKRDGKTLCAASLVTDIPFFCIAGVWQRGTRDYPDAFAALTVSAYPDLAMHKDRHVAVAHPDDWFDWLLSERPALDILRRFPEDSFKIMPPIQQSFEGLAGAA